ncbi:hypothetical protein APHAL10511_007183 [Amanita phalloides]|nr:hypothetical protein APHAL10511_007183 [Amanita phalloides]
MAAPSHYLRSIHSSFAAHSPSSWGSHNVLFDLGGLINQYPPGLGYGPQEVPYRTVTKRRLPHSASFESPKRVAPQPPFAQFQSPHNKFDPFADENTIELVRPTPFQSSQPLRLSFQQSRPPLSLSSPSTPSPPVSHSTVHNPWPPSPSPSTSGDALGTVNTTATSNPSNNREARARLVAGILLNRVHAVGKPMRRRYFAGEPREYVKSRLSSVITADV